MRKPLALILGAMMALSLAPLTSHASAQCPYAVKDDPNAAGVSIGYKLSPRILIASGPAELPANPANNTGLQDLGDVGCDSTVGQLTDGTANTNYLTPGSQVLKVVVYNYPADVDHPVTGGCLKFGGAPSATCTGAGEKKLTWTFVNTNFRACFCWRSQTIAIPGAPQSTLPGGTLSATATVPVVPDQGRTKVNMTRTYKTVGN